MTPARALRSTAALCAALAVLAPALPAARAGQALPPASLIERVRANLERDDAHQAVVSYRFRRRSYEVSRFGKLENGDERLIEHVPSSDEPSGYFRRLLAVNGKPLPPEELRLRDEQRRQNADERRRARAAETPAQRDTRLREQAERRREARAQVDDAFRVFAYEVRGHELVDGAMRLAIRMTPRRDAPTHSDIGRHLKKLEGTAWVDEEAGQLVRLEMHAVDTISLGLGFIGRLNEGSRGVFRRAPVAGDLWMPVEVRFHGSGRTLVFRPFEIDTYAIYSDFRRMGDPAAEP